MQLLNIGVGGQASVTSGFAGVGSTLAGLVKGTGTTTTQSSYGYKQPMAQTFSQVAGGANSLMTGFSSFRPGSNSGCWVAAELFGGWDKIKTHLARFFIQTMAPKWFRDAYMTHGEVIASYISNKPILKALLRPFFEAFAFLGACGMKEVAHGSI